MFYKSISLLLAFLFVFTQPIDALAHQIRWYSDQNPPAGGLGFFLDPGSQANQGQYLMRGPLGALWLTGDAIWLTRWEEPPVKEKGIPARAAEASSGRRGVNLKINFPGANPHARLVTEQPMSGVVSVFQGQDSQGWSTGLPLWGQVRYQDLYPGVDLVIRSTAAGFAWAYEVQPGADASRLRMNVQGADRVKRDSSGSFAQTAVGDVYLPPLTLEGATFDQLQSVKDLPGGDAGAGEIYPVAAAAATGQSLLDNPAKLDYSTFLGGASWEAAFDVAVDAYGAAYLVGETASASFPVTPGAFDVALAQTDVFAVKLAPHGALSYATFIGGSNQETGWSVAVENGVAYIGGGTWSTDFPVTSGSNAFAGEEDAFIVALNATGTGLTYSRLLGGGDQDSGYAIAVQSGSAYLTGFTYSNDFMGAGYSSSGDVFVVKLTATGALSYVRATGGNQEDAGFAIAVVNGVAWVTGETWSSNFTSVNYGEDDVFILSLSTTGAVATRRSYGGAGEESGKGIALNSSGAIYVAGTTNSPNFPFTEGALNGARDAFLLQVNSTNTSVVYATALGGTDIDQGKDLALDSLGGIIVAGGTQSADFPVTADAFQSASAGSADGFVTRYLLTSTSPGHRTYSSYLGGSGFDDIDAVALSASSFAYLTGLTQSANFPVSTDGLYQTLTGTQDAFFTMMAVGPVATVSILKTTNYADANTAPGPYVRVGSPVTWRYDVANTGELALSNVRVTDDKGVAVTCPRTSLNAGESMRCTASGTATLGQYTNLGSVSATTPYGSTIRSSDVSHYFGSDPRSQIIKKTNGVDANTSPGVYLQQGSEVTWTYEVTNTGNVDLTDVTVVDNNGTPTNAADDVTVCTIPLLAAGATDATTCHMEGTARAGQYTNIAVVTGTAPGTLGSVTDNDPSSYFGSAPALSLEKRINNTHVTAAPGPYLLVGSAITWQYVVTNTGNVALTNVTVRDDNGTPDSTADDRTACTGVSLAVGASTTCTLTGSATAGQYHNTATVTGTPPVGQPASAQDDSYYFGSRPQVSLNYSVNSDPADASPGLYVLAGSTLALAYQVTNTGNVDLSNLTVVDNNGTPTNAADDITVCTIPSLAAGASQSCTRSLAALTGQRNASATVRAAPPSPLASVTAANAMYYFGAAPTLTMVKRTNNQDGAAVPGVYVLAGSTVNWSYTVTNTGNVALAHVAVVDDRGTPADPADDQTPVGCADVTLNPGASVNCTLSGTAPVGQYSGTAMATGAPPSPLLAVTASDTSHSFGTILGVTLVKQTNGQDAESAPGPLVALGSAVTWTYTVTNTSNVAVDIAIVDDNGTPAAAADDITFCTSSLSAGASTTCTRSGTATAGQYANTARVTATPPGGLTPATAQDTSHYFGVAASINIVKSTNTLDANTSPGPYIHVGDPVNWTYEITNTGNVTLTDIEVTDDQGVTVSCPADTLLPSASMTCTGSGTASPGQYANTGTVTALPPAGFSPVTDSDASHYFGSTAGVNIVKLTNGVDAASPPGPYIRVGQPVTWTYVVTNSGNVTLTNITVTDNRGAAVTCQSTSLAPGAQTTCTASGTAIAGQYSNTGSVSARVSGENGLVYDSDTSYYFGASPSIQIIKKTNGEDANTAPGPYIPVGEAVNFTYEVSNVGNIDLENVVVSDESGPVAGCAAAELVVGQTYTCGNSIPALTGAQVTSGSASASAKFGMGAAADSDVSHYFGYLLKLNLLKYTNGVHASESPGPELLVGEPVVWTYAVTNQSNVPLSEVTVTDNRGVVVSCPKSTLGVAEVMTCTGSGRAVAEQYSNIGRALGWFEDDTVDAEDASYYYGIAALHTFLPVMLR